MKHWLQSDCIICCLLVISRNLLSWVCVLLRQSKFQTGKMLSVVSEVAFNAWLDKPGALTWCCQTETTQSLLVPSNYWMRCKHLIHQNLCLSWVGFLLCFSNGLLEVHWPVWNARVLYFFIVGVAQSFEIKVATLTDFLVLVAVRADLLKKGKEVFIPFWCSR
jgi:hypothetical protein